MSKISIESNDRTLRRHLTELLEVDIGFSFEIVGQLYIRQISDGFAVGEDIPSDFIEEYGRESWESVFESADEALNLFFEYRSKYQVGDDYAYKRLAESE